MASEFYHRLWNPPEDYEMALEWAAGHGNGFTPLRWLPANGFVVLRDDEPILMFWMYFDNSSPVVFVEWVVSRPGLKASETRTALVYAMDEIIPQMMMMGGAEVVSTRSPKGFVRDMVKHGWSIHDKELCSMVYVLREEEVLNETL